MGDVVVYLVPGGKLYLGCFSNGDCFEWPAVEHGWHQRKRATSSAATDAVELPDDLAQLALRLSGVRVEDVQRG
jgi:hypothetical protein